MSCLKDIPTLRGDNYTEWGGTQDLRSDGGGDFASFPPWGHHFCSCASAGGTIGWFWWCAGFHVWACAATMMKSDGLVAARPC
jgi:hypothetical protein